MTRSWPRALTGLALVLALAAPPAHAGWPTPAAGASGSGDPEVVLTFDDGPHGRFTPMILDELARRDLQAIFFWVGRRLRGGKGVELRHALVRRAVDDGHLVANHTMTHPHLCAMPPKAAADEIDANARLLEELSGLPMILFRAPYGDHCRRLYAMLVRRGLDHFHWDIDAQEWSDHDPKRTARYIIGRLRHLEGRAVVLMHDTHYSTVRALPRVLDWIEAENRRRAGRDRPPIRILPPSELIAERPDARIASWAADTAARTGTRWARSIADLIP